MIVNLSTKGFESKPNLSNLPFETHDVSLEELSDKIAHGYTFANVYKHTGYWENIGAGILKDYYIGSYSINIDLDHQTIPMEEKLAVLNYQPTIAYKTFSDVEGDYRYRFIYVFNEIIHGQANYKVIYEQICEDNNLDCDASTKFGYKLMNGTNKNVVCNFNKIYNVYDYITDNSFVLPLIDSIGEDNIVGDERITKDFLDYFNKNKYTDTMLNYKDVYRNYEHSPIPIVGNDVPIIELPSDYYEIYRLWSKKENGRCIKLKDKMHRRWNLFRNLIIRRLICPDLTLDELLYALAVEMASYIDNSKDKITKRELVNIAINAYKADPSEFNYKRPRNSMVNLRYCLKYNKTKKEVRNKHNAQKNTENKKKNDEIISTFYNKNWTIQENIDYIEEKTGIKFSNITIRRWRKDNNLSNNNKINNRYKESSISTITLKVSSSNALYEEDNIVGDERIVTSLHKDNIVGDDTFNNAYTINDNDIIFENPNSNNIDIKDILTQCFHQKVV